MKLILHRFNGVRISDFHYRYNEASMETRRLAKKKKLHNLHMVFH